MEQSGRGGVVVVVAAAENSGQPEQFSFGESDGGVTPPLSPLESATGVFVS